MDTPCRGRRRRWWWSPNGHSYFGHGKLATFPPNGLVHLPESAGGRVFCNEASMKIPLSPTRQRSSLAILAALILLAACATSPTGRRQLKLLPDDQVAQMGEAAYAQMRQKQPVVREQPVTRYVECVVGALTGVVGAPKGGGKWEVTTFQSDEVNAFALPGGKIGVDTGLFKAARTPDQLAAVIGHEIAHVQADHPNARLSTQYATDAGLSVIQALAQGSRLEGQQAMALLGLGAQVGVLLPFSRAQESEADVLGLRYLAEAGFDPRASVELWQNMAKVGGGGGPAFLSTHPSGEQRIGKLQEKMPEALQLYRQAQARGRHPACTAATP
jgi:predicted Zn-dependent protease